MGLRFQHSNQPWRKTLHTLVCICVVLSNVFSFLAMTPQVVQAGAPLPQPEKSAGNKVKSSRPVPVAHAANGPVAGPANVPIVGANSGQIKGTVFQDFNSNGVMDTTGNTTNPAIDVGVAGISVKAYDATGTQVGATATTAANGTYTISGVTDGANYRVEFSNLPSGYESSFHSITTGIASGTSVQFVSGGSGNVSFGINRPCDYCQANPNLVDTLMNIGVQTGPNQSPPSPNPAFPDARTKTTVALFPSYNPNYTSGTASNHDLPVATQIGSGSETGAVWGVAYARPTKKLYVSALFKKHAGFGPGGPGAIYVLDLAGNLLNTFTVPNATANAHNTGDYFNDNGDTAWEAVGKQSLGGIAASDDGTTIFVMNLEDRTLYKLDATTGAVLGSQAVPLTGSPTPGGTNANCASSDVRPWAVKYYIDTIYVGMVCSAQSTNATKDLFMYVYTVNPTTLAFAATPVLAKPLNYARGVANITSPGGAGLEAYAEWNPWRATFQNLQTNNRLAWPQPMLADIEFDRGNMILVLNDRNGHQGGNSLPSNPSNTATLYQQRSAGDILRACGNPQTGWTLENNATCGGITTGGASNSQGPGAGYVNKQDNNETGSGEYYSGDHYEFTGITHQETIVGGAAQIPGYDQVAVTAFDAIQISNNVYDGGVVFLNNTTGNSDASYRQYDGDNSGSAIYSSFGKGVGLGDMIMLCDPAPLEIGNRVWLDANEDGIQDPDEVALPNVMVELTDANGNHYTTVTNAEGEYYFSGSNVTGGIQPNQPYTVTIDTAQTALKNYDLTTANANSGASLPDGADSDASMVGALAQINLTTGNAGQNDHTHDFGFHLVELSLGNRLWYDTNNDGLDNDGVGGGLGTGIAGVTIQLLDATNTLIATTLTDAAGYYRFDKLTPGAYTVVISTSNFASGGLLENYQNSTPTFNTSTDANDNGTVNGTLGSGGDVRAAVTLTDLALPTGETSVGGGTNGPNSDVDDDLTVDFGFYKLTLGNRVWLDSNYNGLDDFEPGMASIPVTLTTSAGAVVATTTTDANGYYTFTNLISGTYIVQITAPAIYESTAPDAATNNTDGDDNGQGEDTGVVSSLPFALTPGVASGAITVNTPSGHTRNYTLDFGLDLFAADLGVLKSVEPPTYTLGVATPLTFTIVITNYGPEEVDNAPITDTQPANVTFNSWRCTVRNAGSGDGTSACGAASGSGDILTTVSLHPGASATWIITATLSAAATSNITNTVSETLPPSMIQTTSNHPDQAYAIVVPNQSLFSAGNRVWLDTNDNGLFDNAESGVANILMQLLDTNGQVLQTTTTGANGYYRFDHITAGAYEIAVAASNFNAANAAGYRNSSGVTITTTNALYDDYDHGLNSFANPTLTGVHSGPFTLGPGLQPTGETAVGGGADGPYGDANSNLTIDFGFNKQHSGNQLWYDANNNGVFDAGEAPIPAGVVVVMNAVIGGIDIGPVLTTTTDANGQYDFAAANNVDLSTNGTFLYVAIPPGQPALNSYLPSTGIRHAGGGVDNENTGAIDASGIITSGLFFAVPGSTANGAVVNNAAGVTYQSTLDFGFVLQTYTVGNRVWLDTNNNGLFDANEIAVPGGTLLELLNSSGDIISTTVTTAGGYYSFTNLLAGTYEVAISAKNFVGPGAGYQDSTSTTAPSSNVADDNHDHGINVAKPGVTSIRSGPITLGPGLQPTGESDGVHSPAGDANDNLTIDFGFYKLTLGNIIWSDDNNDGLFDATSESGIDGVTVRLFASDGVTEILVGADGVLGTADDAPGGMVTSNGGQYTFTGLTPGDYIVKAKLPTGDTSSSGLNASPTGPYEPAPDTNNNLDNDNNGVNATGADDGWAVTLPVNLTPGATGAATNNVVNYNAGSTINPTVDIGMFHELALGNLIWNDVNNNGIFDSGTESSIDGVQVNLYFDTNNNNVIDAGETTPIATTMTAGGGLYLFSDLVPGNYMVELDASNFTAGNVLENYTSSTGTNGSVSGPYETAPDPELSSVDNDDNGSVNGVLGSGGSIRTQMVNLEEGHEPTNENPDNDTDAIDTSDNLAIDFGVFRYASLGDYTWIDLNKNGVQDTGEPPLAGVTVQLFTGAGTPVASTVTDANGYYLFTNLLPNDYYVVFTPPNGFTITQQNASGDDTIDSDANPVTGVAAATTLVLDERDTTWDVGFISPLALGNLVWYDTNNNGKVDNGEYGIPHVAVELYQDTNGDSVFSAGDTLISTTTTSASGFYSFTNLLPTSSISTTYLVVIPSTNFANNGVLNNYQNSSGTVPITNTLNSQDNGIDGTLNGASGFIASRVFTLTLDAHEIQPIDDGDNPPSGAQLSGPFTGVTDNLPYPNDTNWTVDFGFYKLTLGNQIWYDANNNGLYEPNNGEIGLQGITVTLLSGGAPVLTTTTDANGVYTFTGLISGTYQVRIIAPSGLVSSQDTANSSATSNADSNDKGPGTTGQVIISQPFPLIPGNPGGAITVSSPTGTTFNPTLDFGLIQFIEIGNRLWIEADNDGDATTGTISPVVGQIVTATSSTGAIYTATTDALGLYTITVPANDVYTVTTSTPVGTVPSTVITSVANDSNATANNDKNHRNTGTVVSVKTTDNLSVDFGFHTPLAQFGDRVWLESDTDGLASTGVITPLAGLTITATDSSGATHSTTTNALGYYSFTLPVGTYTMTYGRAPVSYGIVVPSSTPGGNSENGNAGLYEESGNPDQSHANTTTVTVTDGQANWHIDFAFHNLVEIGNRLWIENDTDGDATTGTVVPVAGQVVTVTSSTGVVYTTTTDANGLYTITVPANTTYTVTTATPAGTVPSLFSGTPGDNQSHTPTGTTVTVGNTNNFTIDFGFHAPLAQFGDRVWLESDTDGLASTGGITPVAGLVITATYSGGTHIYTTTTNATGYYSFAVPPGVYVVTYGAVPASYGITAPSATPGASNESGNAGLYTENSNPDQSHINGTTVTVNAGETNWHIDFAFNQPVPTATPTNTSVPPTATPTNTPVPPTATPTTTPVTYSLGNRLWVDDGAGNASQSNNGQVDSNEKPVPSGVLVELLDGNGNPVLVNGQPATTTTDANGYYRFDNLPAGQYQVRVAANNFAAGGKLMGYVSSNGQNTDFSSAGNNHDHGDNPINPAVDGVKSTLVTLSASNPIGDVDNSATGNASNGPNGDLNDNLTVDFGFFVPASIGNYVWLDKDVDGVQDAGEPAVPGVAVALFKADGSPATDVNGNLIVAQTTDANGKYMFSNLPPGGYYVQFTPPANYFISPQDQGADDAVDSDANPTTGKTTVATLGSGEQDVSWDLGLYLGAAIGNYVWDDKNGNGLQDAGEPGLSAVTVTLYDSTNTPVTTTQTDAQGHYGFSSLTPGGYSVQFTTPTGYVPTRPNQGSDDTLDSDAVNGHTALITLTNGQHDTTWDAGFTPPAAISSYVWNDGIRGVADGIKTPGELGVPGVTVILLDSNGQEITHTVTDQAGFFQFTNIVPGAYIIKFVTPTNTEFTQVVPGINDNSAANQTTGETIVVALQPGQVAISWNAGLVSVPTGLETEPEPSRGTINIYLPDIQNGTQAAEGRSGFKKPLLTAQPQVLDQPQTLEQPQTLDQIVVEYWHNLLLWVDSLTNKK